MNERIGLLTIHLAADAADIDVNDVGRGIEMKIPDVLQQQRSGDYAPFMPNQILEQLKLSRQELDLSTGSAHCS
jgi:hypothetical protein